MTQGDRTIDLEASQPSVGSDDEDSAAPGWGRLGMALWAGAGLCLLATGLVLWDARGAAVFTDVLSAAIAWCF